MIFCANGRRWVVALQAVIRLILIAAGKSNDNGSNEEPGSSEIVSTMRRRLSHQDDSLSAIFDLTTDGIVDLDLIFSSTIFDDSPLINGGTQDMKNEEGAF